MASRQVALLRGINVGHAKRVAMADLRQTPASDAARIEKGIEKELGVSCRVTVLTGAEVSAIVSKNPLEGCRKQSVAPDDCSPERPR